jgi:hypothetical protein
MYIQNTAEEHDNMNLRAAQKELRSRSPNVLLPVLALETLVVVSFSWILVSLFA